MVLLRYFLGIDSEYHTFISLSSLLVWFFLRFICLFVYYVYSVLPACAPLGQKRLSDLIRDLMNHHVVAGIELRTFGKIASALTH